MKASAGLTKMWQSWFSLHFRRVSQEKEQKIAEQLKKSSNLSLFLENALILVFQLCHILIISRNLIRLGPSFMQVPNISVPRLTMPSSRKLIKSYLSKNSGGSLFLCRMDSTQGIGQRWLAHLSDAEVTPIDKGLPRVRISAESLPWWVPKDPAWSVWLSGLWHFWIFQTKGTTFGFGSPWFHLLRT